MIRRNIPMTRRAFLQDSAVASLVGCSATVLSASASAQAQSRGERHYRIGVLHETLQVARIGATGVRRQVAFGAEM